MPGTGEIVVRCEASGINYLDTYHRTGLYPNPLPFVPGMEGAGLVTAAGAEVTLFRIGDRVAWTSAIGSYAASVKMPAEKAVAVPEGVELRTAAAVMLQGMTAHYLTPTRSRSPGTPASSMPRRAAWACCSCRWRSSAAPA